MAETIAYGCLTPTATFNYTPQEVVEIAAYAQSIDTVVSLEGVAQWDTETFEIASFFASSARNIQQKVVDTFENLSESYGHYFNEIGDVDAFVRLCRE